LQTHRLKEQVKKFNRMNPAPAEVVRSINSVVEEMRKRIHLSL
jgi:hypothetical protein